MRTSSINRTGQLREYSKERVIFLDNAACARCANPATQVHHTRGRVGRLLNDKRFWIGVCNSCHDAIHANPNQARRDGFLASPREWNVFPVEVPHAIA